MPIITWLILAKLDSKTVAAWCIGGFMLGLGIFLLGMRAFLPVWATYTAANFLILLGVLTRLQSFKVELGSPWRPGRTVVIACVLILIFEFIRQKLGNPVLRLQYMTLTYSVLFFYLAFVIRKFSRKSANRSALWIAGSHGILGVALLARCIEVGFSKVIPDGTDTTLAGMIIVFSCLMVAVISDIAYAGIKLEQEHSRRQQAEHEYEGILRTTKDGFFIADTSGRMLEVNDTLCSLLGYSRRQLLKMRFQEIDKNHSKSEIDQEIQRLLSTGFHRFETRHQRSDGSGVDVEISITHVPGEQDRFLGFIHDITVRKHFQDELEQRVLARTAELATARAEAESANAVQRRFMTNVSHEMRTPLNSILGFAELGKVKSARHSDRALDDFFSQILGSGQRLHKLVESLLKLAQEARNEHARVGKDDMDLIMPEALVTRCVSQFFKAAQARDQEILVINTSTLSAFSGDKVRLQQVLENVLGNALRYSPDRSTVTVLIKNASANDGQKQLSIQVMDEGCGIPEKELQAIFEQFFESSRTATGAGGTGLGLALCKSIILRHNGTISVSNRPQGGAIFEIRLPQRQLAHCTSPSSTSACQ